MNQKAIVGGVAAGAANGVLVYQFVVAEVELAVALAVVYAVAVSLTVHHWRVDPNRGTESGWAAAAVALPMFAAVIGVGPALPVSNDLRFGLQLLVFGVGVAAMQLGVATMRRPDGEDVAANAHPESA